MKCTICKTDHTHHVTAAVTLQRGTTVVVIRNVPAEICEDYSECPQTRWDGQLAVRKEGDIYD